MAKTYGYTRPVGEMIYRRAVSQNVGGSENPGGGRRRSRWQEDGVWIHVFKAAIKAGNTIEVGKWRDESFYDLQDQIVVRAADQTTSVIDKSSASEDVAITGAAGTYYVYYSLDLSTPSVTATATSAASGSWPPTTNADSAVILIGTAEFDGSVVTAWNQVLLDNPMLDLSTVPIGEYEGDSLRWDDANAVWQANSLLEIGTNAVGETQGVRIWNDPAGATRSKYLTAYHDGTRGYLRTDSTGGDLYLQDTAHADVHLFASAASTETRSLKVSGYASGDALRTWRLTVGEDRAQSVSQYLDSDLVGFIDAAQHNIAGGSGALRSVAASTGYRNTAYGDSALRDITNGYRNVGIGFYAGAFLTDDYDNLAIGSEAMGYLDGALRCVSIGTLSMYGITDGNQIGATDVIAIGNQAVQNMYYVRRSVAIGSYAMVGAGNTASTGVICQDCVAIGDHSMDGLGGASYAFRNTAIGTYTARSLTGGDDNILIGYGMDVDTGTQSGLLRIGSTGSNATPLIEGDMANLTLTVGKGATEGQTASLEVDGYATLDALRTWRLTVGEDGANTVSQYLDSTLIHFNDLTKHNLGVGGGALASVAASTGQYNTAYGEGAGGLVTTGSNNLFLGYGMDADGPGDADKFKLGCSQSNTVPLLTGNLSDNYLYLQSNSHRLYFGSGDDVYFNYSGTQMLALQTGGGSTFKMDNFNLLVKSPDAGAGADVLALQDSAGAEKFSVSAAGRVTVNSAYYLPTVDGSANELLTTDGADAVTWGTLADLIKTISGYNAANNQVLVHEAGVVKFLDLTTDDVITDLQADGVNFDLEEKHRSAYLIDAGTESTWTTWESGTECP